jgi:hypothetical protein
MMGYDVRNRVLGKKLSLVSGEQRIVVDRKRVALYEPPPGDIRVKTRGGKVYMAIGAKVLEMGTPVAVKVGFALAKNGGACQYLGDVVSFDIGGEEFTLLPDVAVQVGGAILLKADKADDFQRRVA